MRLRNSTIVFFALLSMMFLSLAESNCATAQTSKGILTGVARDSTGALLPNATIVVTNEETQEARTTKTLGNGAYRVEALSPGRYNVVATLSGFNTARANDVVIDSSIITSYDVTFSVGGSADTITVEAQNSGINTENGQLAGVIEAQKLRSLPIFTLNPVELALTVPGVQPVSQGSSFSNGINIEVNGARPRANNFLLDGQEINDVGIGGQAFQPNIPDLFQNVTVITNNASAEYGRAGGAVVNLVTKAGTNVFHGSAFERYSGSGLDSLDGVSRQGIVHGAPPPGYVAPQKARFNQHQYGFTVGGPILKGKLFAFGALQLSRFYGAAIPNRLELPDASGYAQIDAFAKAGNAQAALLERYLSGGTYLTQYVAFPGNGIVDSLTVTGQSSCPNGCDVTTGFFQRPNQSQQQPDTQWAYRIDYTPRAQDSLSYRYLHDRQSASPDFQNNGSALVGFDTLQGGPSELGAGTWTHVFGATLVNELRASETRISFAFAPTTSTLANPLYALPTLSINSIAVDSAGSTSLGPNQNFPQGRSEDLYQVQDTISINRGRQALRLGFDIGRIIEKDLVSQNAKGTLTFNDGGSGTTSLGNFLLNQLGPSGSVTKTFGSTRVDPHGWRSGVFAQDDVKLSPDFTLNVGIRYDYFTNPENSLPYPAIDPANPYQAINTVIKVANDFNNFAPRIGFAYSPHSEGLLGAGTTVFRGGFGAFYDSPFSNFVVNAAQSTPNAIAATLTDTSTNGLQNASSLISTITPTLLPTSSVLSVVKNAVNPLTYQFNVGIEHQLSGSNLIGVRYVGSLGKKLYANKQFNYFANGTRLNPTRGVINARGNFASSSYNGAQVEFTHNFDHGLLISANYVYSKNLDNSSEIFTTGAGTTSYPADLGPNGFYQEWGPSAYDHRHFVSLSYVWAPAGLRSSNKLADAACGLLTRHWTLSGIEQFQTGSYSTFSTNGYDTNRDGSSANDRPLIGNYNAPLATAAIDGGLLPASLAAKTGVYYDLPSAVHPANGVASLVPVSASSVHWLVPFQPQNQDLHQEIGRNSFENPGSTTNNIAVEKGIGLKYLHLDRSTFIVRAEVNNIGNHNDVGILDTRIRDIGTTNFLNPSNARIGSPPGAPFNYGRNVILWGKITF